MASRTLLDRLGLAPDLSLGELSSIPWNTRGSSEPLDALISQGQADPSRFEPFAWSDDATSGLSFFRSRQHPSLIRVEGAPVCTAAVVGSARRVGADSLVFVAVDGSALRVGARLLTVEGDRLALDELASDEVEAQEFSGVASARFAALASVELAPSARESELRAVFDGLELSPWLADEAVEIAERGGVGAMSTALGLVSRLIEPAVDDPSAMLASVLEGRAQVPAPRAALRRWLLARSSDEQAQIRAHARSMIEQGNDALAALSVAVEEDHAALGTIARRFVRLRDDLESSRESLLVLDPSDPLAEPLDALDRDASAHGTLLSQLAAMDGERWRAIGWQHPALWWGALAV